MKIKSISIQFNIEIEIEPNLYTTGQRDSAGNWWCTDSWRHDFTSEQAAELERQFQQQMPDAIRVKAKS